MQQSLLSREALLFVLPENTRQKNPSVEGLFADYQAALVFLAVLAFLTGAFFSFAAFSFLGSRFLFFLGRRLLFSLGFFFFSLGFFAFFSLTLTVFSFLAARALEMLMALSKSFSVQDRRLPDF